jgi:hypothetical protein
VTVSDVVDTFATGNNGLVEVAHQVGAILIAESWLLPGRVSSCIRRETPEPQARA